jgi:hypothetical protein
MKLLYMTARSDYGALRPNNGEFTVVLLRK